MQGRGALLAVVLLTTGLVGCIGTGGDELDPASVGDPAALLSKAVHDTLLREVTWASSTADGVDLRVDVYRPDAEGPFPTILVLSPYWSFAGDRKEAERPIWYIDYFVPRGYAVALGEMRGTRDSGGCWDFGGPLDQQDGHDIVEHLAAQPWSNGKVGMLGQSHVGMSQVAAAITAPEHLTTVVPIAAVTDWYRYLHKDGAPYVLNRATPPAYFAVHASPSTEAVTPDWVLTQAQTACVDNVVHLSQSAELDGNKDAYWQERDLIAGAGNIRASVFLVHGFLDENVKTDHFLDLWQALPDDVAKKAWFGQWYHEHPAYYEWREDLHRWFDHWLLGIDNGILDEPTVTVQTSDEHARAEADWPGTGVTEATWMLDDEGLVPAADGDATGTAGYVSTPLDDRGRDLPLVDDDLVFRSEPLAEVVHLAGEPVLALEAALDQPTGRWAVVLYDEAPDGSLDEITRAFLDARHREDLANPSDVPVGEPVAYTLRFYPRDHVVEPGHRIVLVFEGGDQCYLFSSELCEGTGILPVERVVTHTVHTGPGSGTRLVLPVATTLGPERALTELDDWLDDLPE